MEVTKQVQKLLLTLHLVIIRKSDDCKANLL
jgi:hypothetical protein